MYFHLSFVMVRYKLLVRVALFGFVVEQLAEFIAVQFHYSASVTSEKKENIIIKWQKKCFCDPLGETSLHL